MELIARGVIYGAWRTTKAPNGSCSSTERPVVDVVIEANGNGRRFVKTSMRIQLECGSFGPRFNVSQDGNAEVVADWFAKITTCKESEHDGLHASFDEMSGKSRKRLLDWCAEHGYVAVEHRIPTFADAFIDYSGREAHMYLERCTVANQPNYKCPIVAKATP